MNRQKGFTLVEMLLVLMIIAVLIALLVPILPAVISDSKEKQTRMFLAQLEVGLEQYKSVYGEYPSDNLSGDASSNNGSAKSLFDALQGNSGQGWKRALQGVSREFGPYFEATKGLVGFDDSTGNTYVFLDAFGGRVLYYKAHHEFPLTLSQPYQRNRYRANVAQKYYFSTRDDSGTGNMGYNLGREHWVKKLTQQVVYVNGEKREIPYRPDTFLLWTPGPDARLGYYRYDQATKKYFWDLNGLTQDITNF